MTRHPQNQNPSRPFLPTVLAVAFSTTVLLACTQQSEPTPTERADLAAVSNIVLHDAPQQHEPRREADAANPAPAALEEVQGSRQLLKTESKIVAGAVMAMPVAPATPGWMYEGQDRERYQHLDDNPVKLVSEQPVSTFSVDVDTESYSNTRRMLREGRMPTKDAVRVEEFINYFDYGYQVPANKSVPFSVMTEVAPAPWNANNLLLQVGIKGYEVAKESIPAANLVFLVDVSGSMQMPDKLELVKQSLAMLTDQLSAKDKVSLVVYAGAAGLVLEPTAGNDKAKIKAALQRLTAGGSTNGGAGIELAYSVAQQAFIKGGINRVVIASDGDMNVGTVGVEALKAMIEEKRKGGITLTTLGYGSGNYNSELMEQLADIGNGNAAYIDSLHEARKVLVDQLSSTVFTIAQDVKIQLEFSPRVKEYRLIGYENRLLNREDFNNDKVDAGDIGAGHTVTAIYELVMEGSEGGLIDPLRYGDKKPAVDEAHINEMAFLRLRYKQPGESKSRLIEQPVKMADIHRNVAEASDSFRFASAVAAWGQLLRGGEYTGSFSYGDVRALAQGARGTDAFGYRGEFLQLVNLSESLATPAASVAATAAVME
ncbi:MAG TPA: VWA domain-containing protein [Pseudomonadales bacterium]